MVHHPPAGPDGRSVEIVGLDCSIISHPRVWEASGHLAGFADPMQTCRHCKRLFRADHVAELLDESEWVTAVLEACEPGAEPGTYVPRRSELKRWAETKGKKLAPGLAIVRDPGLLAAVVEGEHDVPMLLTILSSSGGPITEVRLPCPNCGGELTEPRQFNLMFETFVGAVRDEESKAYLRPETAQGMFYNFKNVIDSTRVKVPFGICQVGRSFRNEVTPRNYIFRSREFEQMELEFFVHPSEADTWYRYWRQTRFDWWCGLGLAGKNLRLRDHDGGRARALRQGFGRLLRRRVRLPVLGREGLHRARGHRLPQRLRPSPAPAGERREARVLRRRAQRAVPAARHRARRGPHARCARRPVRGLHRGREPALARSSCASTPVSRRSRPASSRW